MKIINKISTCLLVGALALVGCESLEQNPYEDLSTDKAFTSIDDASYWRNGFYRSLRNVSYGEIVLAPDVQADLLNATLSYGNRRGLIHSWTIQSEEGYLTTVWRYRYQALTSLNQSIDKFPSIPTVSADEKATLDQYLGEAYAIRAYYFFQLLEKYSPEYSDANKSTPELGIPLLTTYDVTASPKRSTIEETYNQILSDIAQAERLLASKAGVKGSTSFTIDAVKALKARVLFGKQDYKGAYEIAKALIDDNKYPLTTTKEAFQKIWHNDDLEESIVQLFVSSPDELPRLPDNSDGSTISNGIYLGYNATTKKYTPDFVPSKWIIDLYDDADIRKSVYFKEFPLNILGVDYTGTLVNKYPGNPALYTGVTNYMHKPKIFRIAEFYLIAAEAAYKNADEANAKVYLNKLRTARGLADVTSSGTTLFEDIKNERLRELAFEGTRLNDLKRWGEGVKRHDPQNLDYILKNPSDQFHLLDKPANHYMLVWPIPSYDIGINPNLKQNTGY